MNCLSSADFQDTALQSLIRPVNASVILALLLFGLRFLFDHALTALASLTGAKRMKEVVFESAERPMKEKKASYWI